MDIRQLPKNWATSEDFSTLFQYFWHRDFPIDIKSTGAKRIDWTIHIGIIVRSIGDLMGLVTRFERGGRKDAIYRSAAGDEIALEWEWQGIKGQNEVKKLKNHQVWSNSGYNHTNLKYGVLITYIDVNSIMDNLDNVSRSWKGADWPLLLIIVTVQQSKKFTTKRTFNRMQMFLFNENGEYKTIRDVPAVPWEVDNSRWQYQIM